MLDIAFNPEYAVPEDETLNLQRLKAQLLLGQVQSQAFDSYPECPLYYIHIDAPQRRIVEDIEAQVRYWKRSRNISEVRIHTEKFPDYLEVWDAREGWSGGDYHINREQTFIEIAKRLKQPRPTVVSRYRAAFHHIIGTEFKPPTWLYVMGLVKLPGANIASPKQLTARYRRLLADTSKKPVPESRLSAQPSTGHTTSVVEKVSGHVGDEHNVDVLLDVQELIDRGLPDADIAEKLDLPTNTDFTHIRERLIELSDVVYSN